MKVLIACEFSGVVRDAFIARGHNAWSCDIEPTEVPGPHIQGDVLDVLDFGWDLMIAHPPCTYIANSGAKHLYLGMKKENGRNEERWKKMKEAALFYKKLWEADIEKICVENPILLGYAEEIIAAGIAPDYLQPWQYGHGETKATGLRLKNLPNLVPTDIVEGRDNRIHFMSPGPNRGKDRSRTYEGVGSAMADQWGEAT